MSNETHADHPAFSARWWEQHYQGHPGGQGSPSPQLIAEVTDLPAGTALDAGCGHGADAVWLAGQGWEVTAVDVSSTVVNNAEEFAARQEPDIAPRISWVVADLTAWEPAQQFDLVVSQYVHPDMPFSQFVARLARAVAPGGTLLVVGHDHADRHSAEHAPQKASIGLEAVTGSLTDELWDVAVAESRTRQVEHGSTQMRLHDLVVKAHRKPSR
ncbi:SAM-dependent methyltransferase [Micromonospora craterilacus]|uniref:SAM-dependent methyltransferase n=1 Tax=Micromonospora craterilacus TaxID=1655439 RepID=A0A2W2GCC1_9ACTN|nr:class I SAM-dependent methyltransferase [Micromonospora craterilacus]PZG24424.1 SAM-dependent methyltransferase [Micromonospora craterilacus]